MKFTIKIEAEDGSEGELHYEDEASMATGLKAMSKIISESGWFFGLRRMEFLAKETIIRS